jgi:hypothetical protein
MATLNQLSPDKPSDNDYVIIWYLQTLIKHNGQCNMYNQGGINAPDANDRIRIQNYLEGQGYIRNLPNDSRTTYQIVEPNGRQFFYSKVYDKVMDTLAKSNDFMQVSSILAELKVDDENNHFSKAITSQIKSNYNVATIEEDDSIMLMDDAKEKYLASKYNFEEEKASPLLQYNDNRSGDTWNLQNATVGNLNTGKAGNQSSSEMARDSPLMESKSNNNPIKPKTTSWLEILSWIVGIIAGAIAIYEFILKHILHTQSIF